MSSFRPNTRTVARPDRRQSLHFNAERPERSHTHGKVADPSILARMKKRRDLPGVRIDARQIGTLLQVTVPTGERKIVKLRRSALLPGDDVFNVKRAAERRLWRAAVLASAASAGPHLPRPGTHADYCKVRRAFDCQ
jgi:hypothetical protein